MSLKPRSHVERRFTLEGLLQGKLEDCAAITRWEVGDWKVTEVLLPKGRVILDLPFFTLDRVHENNVAVFGPHGSIAEVCVSDPEGFAAGFSGNLPDEVGFDIGAYRAMGKQGALNFNFLLSETDNKLINVALFAGPKVVQIEVGIWVC